MGAGWEPNRDTFPASRVFEYVDDGVREALVGSDNRLMVGHVKDLPTIFMEEGTGDELAYVGRVNSIRSSSGSYIIDYSHDRTIPPIQNRKLYEFRDELGISDFEFSRTHWAVKAANLFESLYRIQINASIKPRVFNLPDAPVDQSLISVMMPFSAEFDNVYSAISKACINSGMKSERADDIWLNDAIIEDVVHLIATSRVVIADLTNKNPNVFYEVGVAHTLGKEVILLAQNQDDVPFDLRHLRFVKYLNNSEGREKLIEKIEGRLGKLTA